jgi:lipopolysaccharide/colanic/teichoic acid biosynthesis glycosyltransferase
MAGETAADVSAYALTGDSGVARLRLVETSRRAVGWQSAATVSRLPTSTIQRPTGVYVRVVKPIFDRAVAAGVLVVAAVPMAVIAAVVAVTMGRPVLFRQRRVGFGGENFEVLKFRTMRPDRRASRCEVGHDRRRSHKSDADPRHTEVGRFLRRYSLDELPQLINVVRGEMSIVGPRPELESVVRRYPSGLDQRHHVKPGLTGLWQISARGTGPMHEHGEWDLAYVERVSLWTDLRIILRTPRAMLSDNVGS